MTDFVEADTNSTLQVACKKLADGLALNLTGMTVAIKWRFANGPLTTKAMTITDAVNGLATYTFLVGELQSGPMNAEVEVTNAGKVVSSLDVLSFLVRNKV